VNKELFCESPKIMLKNSAKFSISRDLLLAARPIGPLLKTTLIQNEKNPLYNAWWNVAYNSDFLFVSKSRGIIN